MIDMVSKFQLFQISCKNQRVNRKDMTFKGIFKKRNSFIILYAILQLLLPDFINQMM